MPVTPVELLESAKRFDKCKTDNESDYRSCVSRFYYAAYHSANEFHNSLNKPGIPLNGTGNHASFLNQLLHPNVPNTDKEFQKSLETGQILKGMLYNRHQSDYKIDQTVSIRNVSNAMAQAEILFQTIQE